ncbi:MAG TPA: hypothetical protein VIA06_03510 [Candidatus Dormibacteraeota bacterium]|jgi:hypothetical protein|nr:hypothetical protein [Candidatus Dormibacteraeota bacterium]
MSIINLDTSRRARAVTVRRAYLVDKIMRAAYRAKDASESGDWAVVARQSQIAATTVADLVTLGTSQQLESSAEFMAIFNAMQVDMPDAA